MLVEKIKAEVDHCRHRLMKYCRGQGLDLGCGSSKIRMDAIGIDLYHPDADMHMDIRKLDYFPSNHFDYVFSSHVLEEFDNTEAVLKEWLRVLKDGGYLVLYQADPELYYPLGHPQCNRSHLYHFTAESLWDCLKNHGTTLVHQGKHPETKEWSFELVVRKNAPVEAVTTMETISLLIPTKNRPQAMEQFSLHVDKVTSHPQNVEILFGIHEEDKGSTEKAIELKGRCAVTIRSEIIRHYADGKINLSFLWNQIYAKANGTILGYFGDDVLFHTPGWDDEIRKEFEADKNILVCCNDVHVQMGRKATLFFTHKTVHEEFGFYLNEKFRRWYNDTYWDQIYRTAGKLHYREDLITEHLHPNKFPDRADDVYRSMEMFKDQDTVLWGSPDIQKEINDKARILAGLK